MQGVHHGPCNVGVPGGLGPGRAESDLAAVGGAALDRQERLSDISPARVPLDPARPYNVLGFEHQGGLRLQAVVDPLRTRVEVAHNVVHADPDASGIDADVLDVEALGQLLDLGRLVGERLPTPAVFLQDPEVAAWIRRRRDDHTSGIVAGTAWVVANPDRVVAERSIVVLVVVVPQHEVGIAAFQIFQPERALRAVDELAIEQLLELVFVVLQLQLRHVEQIATAGNGIV